MSSKYNRIKYISIFITIILIVGFGVWKISNLRGNTSTKDITPSDTSSDSNHGVTSTEFPSANPDTSIPKSDNANTTLQEESKSEHVSSSEPQSEKYISREQAKSIVLDRAKVKGIEAKKLRIEEHNDNGRLKYRIKFLAENVEYHYIIDATNGEVITTTKRDFK